MVDTIEQQAGSIEWHSKNYSVTNDLRRSIRYHCEAFQRKMDQDNLKPERVINITLGKEHARPWGSGDPVECHTSEMSVVLVPGKAERTFADWLTSN
jgi:hypothetical protein